MKKIGFALFAIIGIFATQPAAAQGDHDQMKGMDMPKQKSEKGPAKLAMQPAQGASVKIISPKAGEVLKSDKVSLQFKLTRGKRGHHVHAYVDGELMGMFESEKGTLNGVKPGKHILELRVVAGDHTTELDAKDRVEFVVK